MPFRVYFFVDKQKLQATCQLNVGGTGLTLKNAALTLSMAGLTLVIARHNLEEPTSVTGK